MKSSKTKENINKALERVLLGKIVGAQGIRGEVRIYAFGDAPSDFNKYEKALLVLPSAQNNDSSRKRSDEIECVVTIEKARIRGNLAIVKFTEINDRNSAEALRETEVYIDAKDLEKLPEDSYYVRDLEGLSVIDDDTGEAIGYIAEVIQNAAQDIYRIAITQTQVETAGETGAVVNASSYASADANVRREALVPAVKEFIKEVDIESGTMRIHFIDGMR